MTAKELAALQAMTTAELVTEFKSLAPRLAEIQDRRQAIYKILERRAQDAAARVRLGALTEDQKAALKRVL